jgi:alkyl sulfatase BDS1-like metallo-beta-lactamase superfamily hydrolase
MKYLLALLLTTSVYAQNAAEPSTKTMNEAVKTALPFADKTDFEEARRGLIEAIPPDDIVLSDRVVWSLKKYDFLQKDAPDTANPSLWRQAQLNMINGLFKVQDGVYQLRGLDISNMTIIEGATGLIIIDPLLAKETAKVGLELYYKHRPRKPVIAVIYSHSHADHFGGVKGVANEKTQIIAPEGFMEHAIAENVIAGTAMGRRAQYQFGPLLPVGERGQIDAGLGKNISTGTITLLPPTLYITKENVKQVIDGVEMIFTLTPGTEAPAEMNIYFPKLRLLNMAENVTRTLHNFYAIRGAEVRDANVWSKYIAEMLHKYADSSEIMIAQHHWPTFGTPRIKQILGKQRDLYKHIHDQTVRMMNFGMKPAEIAEQLKLPESLSNEFYLRGYYGTVSHNSKAVYQKYLGWYDAHPANLNPLPQVEEAKKRVDYMGGAASVLEKAKGDYARGEFRFVASVLKDVVYADPTNKPARELQASALEQLGYQTESATWRNAYLQGAWELRNGMPNINTAVSTLSKDTLQALSLDLFFDFLGVRLNPLKVAGKFTVINWHFTDSDTKKVMRLENSTLTHTSGFHDENANITLSLTRETLDYPKRAWNANGNAHGQGESFR